MHLCLRYSKKHLEIESQEPKIDRHKKTFSHASHVKRPPSCLNHDPQMPTWLTSNLMGFERIWIGFNWFHDVLLETTVVGVKLRFLVISEEEKRKHVLLASERICFPTLYEQFSVLQGCFGKTSTKFGKMTRNKFSPAALAFSLSQSYWAPCAQWLTGEAPQCPNSSTALCFT